MESIIQQTAMDLIDDWISVIKRDGLSEIDATSSELLKVSKSRVLELVSRIVNELDESLLNEKSERKQLGLKVKQRGRSRSYLTDLGWLNYSRSYYKDEINESYCYPVDTMIGVSTRERISPSVSAALVQNAAFVPMRLSSDIVTDGDLTAQSVCNKLRSVDLLEKPFPTTRKNIGELHIFADEDHVSLQDGGTKIVPLVTISEGLSVVGKNRRRLINPTHFTSDISDIESLWKRVYAYADKAYNLGRVERIFIHGDGAGWIKRGLDEFGGAIFALDGFHLRKRLIPFISVAGSECIYKLLNEGKREDFELVARAVIYDCKDASKKKALTENLKYVLNQWDGVVTRSAGHVIGSCTEAQVSHVLSQRLSRNPMGWSEAGANAMASLRVYVKNGGVVTREDFVRNEKRRSELSKHADEIIRSFLDFKLDRSVFERDRPRYGKVTPISVILKSLGSIKNISTCSRN
jgi:hypothetical protein